MNLKQLDTTVTVKLTRMPQSDLLTNEVGYEATYLGDRVHLFYGRGFSPELAPAWYVYCRGQLITTRDSVLDALDTTLHILTGVHPRRYS